jgi:hypothetical protein
MNTTVGGVYYVGLRDHRREDGRNDRFPRLSMVASRNIDID